jgi:hypothetical protein
MYFAKPISESFDFLQGVWGCSQIVRGESSQHGSKNGKLTESADLRM